MKCCKKGYVKNKILKVTKMNIAEEEAATKCETEYHGECIDTRFKMCDNAVIPGHNKKYEKVGVDCQKALSGSIIKHTIQCCPGEKVHSPKNIVKKGEKYESCIAYYKLLSFKIAEGQCVDTFSNKNVCKDKTGRPKPTLTGNCPNGATEVRCCPKEDWYTFLLTKHCEEAKEIEDCKKFQNALRNNCANNKGLKHAKYNMDNVIRLKIKKQFDSFQDIKWQVDRNGKTADSYKTLWLRPDSIKLASETEVKVTFNCKGDPTDPELCVDLFPCNLDRQQLMYRQYTHKAERKDGGPLQYVDEDDSKNGNGKKKKV
jgi:hypothetical protein